MPFEQIPYTNFHGTNQDWMIQQIKQMIADWASYRENLDAAWAAYQDNINSWRQALDTAFNELHTYVYDYFDNLDVQQEINNKLDEFLEDGTLDSILLPYFNTYTQQINNTVNTQNNRITILESEMNTFLQDHPATTGEKDAELVDIRVGYNGETYPTAGDAVRDQVRDLKEDLNSANSVVGYEQLNYSSGYIDCNQSTINVEEVVESSYFKYVVDDCVPNDIYLINGTGSLQARSWCFVDASGNRLSVQTATNFECDNLRVTAPANAAKFISNYQISQSDQPYAFKIVAGDLQNEIHKTTFILSSDHVTAIPQNSNLNTYTVRGNYSIASVAVAGTIANIPAQYGGRLTVIQIVNVATVLQIYTTTNGLMFWRSGNVNGNFNPWKEFANTQTAIALSSEYVTQIPQNSDLNTYTVIGNYSIASVSVAGTIANIPAQYGGRLTVIRIVSAANFLQIYATTNGLIFWRSGNTGGWNAWKEIANEKEVNSEFMRYADKGLNNLLSILTDAAPYNIRFANAVKPLNLINYMGNSQNVHPKVLYFASGFGGHNYWLAYTPYPNSDDRYENPCIAYSDDGLKWTNIPGNPLSDPHGNGYNSDTHLVVKNNTMECWYRYVSDTSVTPVTERICRRTTTNGIDWTPEETLYETSGSSYSNLLSPSVIWDGNKYCVWVVKSSAIDYYETDSDGKNWTFIRTLNIVFNDTGTSVTPWHIDVIKENNRYIIIAMCRRNVSVSGNKCSLFITTSEDNTVYETPYIVIATGSGNWDNYMYRSSIVKVPGGYRIYYSAGTGGATSLYGGVWHMGISESETLDNFKGLYV